MPIKKKLARALTNLKQKKRFKKIRTEAKYTRARQSLESAKRPTVKGTTSKRLKRKLVKSRVKQGAKAFGKGLAIGGGIGAGVGGLYVAGAVAGIKGQKEVSRRKRISKGLRKHHKKRRKG